MGTTVSMLLPEQQGELGMQIVHTLFTEWEQTLSRFLLDSELSRLNRRAGTPTAVSDLLYAVLATALTAAQASQGVYDPSLLDQLEQVGYDRTFDDLPAVQFSPIIPGEPGGGWRGIRVNPLSGYVTLPVGIKLDFSTIFLAVHVLAVWVDPFTHFGWSEVFIPFVSNYRPVWMALGIVGMYLGIAIGIITWLRPLIGYIWWRRLHVLTLSIFALATLHAIGTGSDSHTWWGLGIYIVSYVLVGVLLCRRLFALNKRKHTPVQSPARKAEAAHSVSPQPVRGV